jgi:F-type H+-transporting ATPase subunit b
MQVDWITTIAQIINFLVLVYLLKRFLYQPIVTAMERREAHISQRLEDAAQQSAEAQQQGDSYQKQLQELEQHREQLLSEAKKAAEAQRMQLMDELRNEIATIRTRWQEEVEREQQAFLVQARQMIGEQVCQVARQALDELADSELEQQMLAVFQQKLASVPAADKQKLAQNAAKSGLRILSHFPLPASMQATLRSLVHAHLDRELDTELAIEFEQVPELICGISLKAPGFKLEWNLDSYLARIDEQLRSRLSLTTPVSQNE